MRPPPIRFEQPESQLYKDVCGESLELACETAHRRADGTANRIYGCDEYKRDTGGDHAVLNGCDARLVFPQSLEKFHVITP